MLEIMKSYLSDRKQILDMVLQERVREFLRLACLKAQF